MSKIIASKKSTSFYILLFCCFHYFYTGPASLVYADSNNLVLEEFTPPSDGEVSTYTKTFLISAYYSPLPNQIKYVTGSYDGDIRLNGDGVKAADGTEVYPGMVAAPKSYSFGTKMKIPGIGIVAVHDRGGAIVHAGERNNSYDRLDVWMGYGDIGLQRALEWGKRSLDVVVYGIAPEINEEVTLPHYTPDEKIPRSVPIQLFQETLTLGDEGDEVKKLQEYLQKLDYYSGEPSGVFDDTTYDAVTELQIDSQIISAPEDFGAGHVGPKTMQILASKIVGESTVKEKSQLVISADGFENDLSPGSKGADVTKLQEELIRLHFLGVEPTGFYGEVTDHAVFKFQQSQNIVEDESSPGAGIFGPSTRSVLNEILRERARVETAVSLENQ